MLLIHYLFYLKTIYAKNKKYFVPNFKHFTDLKDIIKSLILQKQKYSKNL